MIKKRFGWLMSAIVAVIVSSILAGCEGGGGSGDSPDSESAAISGNSGMLLINDSSDESTIYFDGVYIGNVEGDGSRQWSVPSGRHVLRVDNAERDNSDAFEDAFSFTAGYVTTIHFDWEEQ